ncbi:hypothetical protein ABT086_10530 [Streptomyces mirabilis]
MGVQPIGGGPYGAGRAGREGEVAGEGLGDVVSGGGGDQWAGQV